jgi:DNA-directed RNA polymerase subunit RPC12/RpoP
MGTGLNALLICCECGECIKKVKDLVKGSEDSNDVRCPECGSALFNCGTCLRDASKFALAEGELTWDCKEGCNP